MSERFYPFHTPHRTCILTFEGEGRSGKGRSGETLSKRLHEVGTSNRVIDQGLKFRTLAELAIKGRKPLDDPVELTTFMQSPATQKSALGLLREVSCMTKEDKNALLYNPAVATASSKIAKVPAAHTIAVGILRQEVQEAVYDDQKVVLIDGRAMEKYGRQFHKERLAVFGLGWYFRCDSSVAAARSLGLAGKEDLTTEEVLRLHAETAEIRHRNFRDQSRTVDPMREPVRAYRLDLHSYYDEAVRDELGTPYKRGRDAVAAGMVVVDTTSTQSIDEMLGPVVEVSMFALLAKGAVSHEAVGIPVRAATGL